MAAAGAAATSAAAATTAGELPAGAAQAAVAAATPTTPSTPNNAAQAAQIRANRDMVQEAMAMVDEVPELAGKTLDELKESPSFKGMKEATFSMKPGNKNNWSSRQTSMPLSCSSRTCCRPLPTIALPNRHFEQIKSLSGQARPIPNGHSGRRPHHGHRGPELPELAAAGRREGDHHEDRELAIGKRAVHEEAVS